MNLEKELAELQDAFAEVDLLTRTTRRSDTAIIELLLKQFLSIRIRMDGNKNHKRPHVHIDYGKERHVASYAIDTGERLVGHLDNKYDNKVRKWIDEKKLTLMQIWVQTQAGQNTDAIVCELCEEES